MILAAVLRQNLAPAEAYRERLALADLLTLQRDAVRRVAGARLRPAGTIHGHVHGHGGPQSKVLLLKRGLEQVCEAQKQKVENEVIKFKC